MLNAFSNSRVDHRYTTKKYTGSIQQVVLKDCKNKVNIGRGARQGNSISPELFTLALEDVFKNIKRVTKGIKINEGYLSYLRFADGIVLIADSVLDLQKMINSNRIKT